MNLSNTENEYGMLNAKNMGDFRANVDVFGGVFLDTNLPKYRCEVKLLWKNVEIDQNDHFRRKLNLLKPF